MPYFWTVKGEGSKRVPKMLGDTTSFTFCFFGEEELKTAQNLICGPYYNGLVDFYNEGQICVGLKENETLVAFVFINRDTYAIRGKSFKLNANEAYLHSMYTFEAYRGRRIAPYLRYKSYGICKDMGITELYSVTEYFNTSSRRFKKKLSVKHKALYLSVKLFNKFNKTYLLKKYDVENA